MPAPRQHQNAHSAERCRTAGATQSTHRDTTRVQAAGDSWHEKRPQKSGKKNSAHTHTHVPHHTRAPQQLRSLCHIVLCSCAQALGPRDLKPVPECFLSPLATCTGLRVTSACAHPGASSAENLAADFLESNPNMTPPAPPAPTLCMPVADAQNAERSTCSTKPEVRGYDSRESCVFLPSCLIIDTVCGQTLVISHRQQGEPRNAVLSIRPRRFECLPCPSQVLSLSLSLSLSFIYFSLPNDAPRGVWLCT